MSSRTLIYEVFNGNLAGMLCSKWLFPISGHAVERSKYDDPCEIAALMIEVAKITER